MTIATVTEFICEFRKKGMSDSEIEKFLMDALTVLKNKDGKTKVVGLVEETTNESKFVLDQANRAVKDNRVKCIMKAIDSDNDKKQVNPITVNEKMQVIDGQGRLEAVKRINRKRRQSERDLMPIRYIVYPGLTIEDAKDCNNSQTRWVFEDYIKSCSKISHTPEAFQILDGFIKSYKSVLGVTGVVSITIGTLANSANGPCLKIIKNDRILLLNKDNEDELKRNLDTISNIVRITKKLRYSSKISHKDKFFNAVYLLINEEGLSAKRFEEAFTYIGNNKQLCNYVFKTSNFEDDIETALKIYNEYSKGPKCRKTVKCILARFNKRQNKLIDSYNKKLAEIKAEEEAEVESKLAVA